MATLNGGVLSDSTASEATQDALFGGSVVLFQPHRGRGYRTNVDALLLATFAAREAANSTESGDGPYVKRPARVSFDLGAGVGAVGLALLRLGATQRVVFVEIDEAAAKMARRNLDANGWTDRGEIRSGRRARRRKSATRRSQPRGLQSPVRRPGPRPVRRVRGGGACTRRRFGPVRRRGTPDRGPRRTGMLRLSRPGVGFAVGSPWGRRPSRQAHALRALRARRGCESRSRRSPGRACRRIDRCPPSRGAPRRGLHSRDGGAFVSTRRHPRPRSNSPEQSVEHDGAGRPHAQVIVPGVLGDDRLEQSVGR